VDDDNSRGTHAVPTYQYSCTDCGHFFEAVQTFNEDSLTTCPECAGKLRKVYNAVGVVFKGSGFYRTDSRTDGRAGSGNGNGNGSGAGSGAGAASGSGADSGSGTDAQAGTSKGKSDSSSSKSGSPSSTTTSSAASSS
jgi:putative FmdB family regulatory protein